jgi:hypothetical protein
MIYIRNIATPILLTAPTVVAGQQQGPDLSYITASVATANDLVANLIPLLVSFGLIVFIWSVIKFIGNSHDAEARSAGLRQMVWGIVGLFAIVSVWGLVGLLGQLVGIEPVTALVLPAVPQP